MKHSNTLKALVAIVLCAASCSTLSAQEMKVVQFRELTNDLTANLQGTSKMDDNGEVAALIKIVTPEKGFIFDGGTLGIVTTEYKTGEVWVYVPRTAQRITIKHPTLGVLRNYTYPVPIEGAKTYEMLLDIGIGAYATITTNVARSEVYIDNEYVGETPVFNKYLNYGTHIIKAVKGKMEGAVELNVTDDRKSVNVNIQMEDLSHLYGDVHVTVENNADIYFAGRRVGTGRWTEQLKEGVYEVETRKINCDPVKTQFSVLASKRNDITAKPPTPHTGKLHLYTRPRNVEATINGQVANLMDVQTLPVGIHQVSIGRKGYVTIHTEYSIERDQTTLDTLQLERINYVKPTTFYLGAAYSITSLSGITGTIGVVYKRHDLQVSYTFGLGKSETLYVHSTDERANAMHYTQSSLGVQYGYQFPMLTHLALTPQVGYRQDQLVGHLTEGSALYGDGATAHCLTLGLKLQFVPMQHTVLFATPAFAIPLKKSNNYTAISDQAGFSAGGFGACIGLLINF